MKVLTDWWGVQLIAENDKEKVSLQKLKKELGDKADYYYEDGDINDTDITIIDNRVENPKYIIELVR